MLTPQLVYLGVGTNLGNRLENLQLAAQLLSPAVRLLRFSSLYETEPWGVKEQPDFLNMVWEVETTLPSESLLRYLKEIEKQMGREESVRYGPRVIDLDILLMENQVVDTPILRIPHPQIAARRFVLSPLVELCPDGCDPISGKRWDELLAAAPDERCTRLEQPFSLGKWNPCSGRTAVMGIINLTPDSFSQDGLARAKCSPGEMAALAVHQACEFVEAGAEILDLGAESTRPGHLPVSAEDELARLLPALTAIRAAFPNALISVDTTKSAVARAAADAGADWINDVSGLEDPALASLIAEKKMGVVLMRCRPLSPYHDTIWQMIAELISILEKATHAGIDPSKIVLDPGLGFGTTPAQNLDLLRGLDELQVLGYPILIGSSRKSFIGHYLQRDELHRSAGTAATVAMGISHGASIVRVHDVAMMVDVVKMTDLLRTR